MFKSMGGAASDSQPPILLNNGQFSGTLSFGENTSIFCHGPFGGPPVNIPDNGGVMIIVMIIMMVFMIPVLLFTCSQLLLK
jgi:hypothetical protein